MFDKRPSHELLVFKAAFSRAVDMIGGVSRTAEKLGLSAGHVTRMRSETYPDTIPGNLFPMIDAAAGYPVMLEAYADLAGYTIRKDEVTRSEMPICIMAGNVAAASGRALQAVLEADADQVITPREFSCIEAEWNTAKADGNRMVEAARAKCSGRSGVKLAAAE